MSHARRHLLQALVWAAGGLPPPAFAKPESSRDPFAAVIPGAALAFPRDHGSHPDFRIEWWYLTGWLDAQLQGRPTSIGLQITFFRVATGWQRDHESRFAARQLIFAHAALAITGRSRLIKAERAARAGFGLAEATEGDTALTLADWSLRRDHSDCYHARISDPSLSIALSFQAQRPPVLQGEAGFSRKGPKPAQASYYYSRPWLQAQGEVAWSDGERGGARTTLRNVRGQAWFDHEWSSELLDPAAQGWDWVGLLFHDGSALMAFQVRHADGTALWRYANWVDGEQRSLGISSVTFEALRRWRSPRSGASWPVAQRLTVNGRVLEVHPLFDDQELDTRGSTGVTYWEGAVSVTEAGRVVGRGYLELTGYAQAMRI